MKKILFAIVITLMATAVQSQVLATANSPEYKNILKMSASQFTRSTFQMGFEHFFDPGTSLFLAAGLSFKDSDYDKTWGIRAEAQMRFHVYSVVKPRESHRLYFAPYILNQYFDTEVRDYSSGSSYAWRSDTFDALGGGMLFGWSYSFANRINLDIYTGGGLRKTFNFDPNPNGEYYYSDGIFENAYSGIVPRLGVDIGFWF